MRLLKAVLTIEAVAFAVVLLAFFTGSLASGLPNRDLGDFALEMATLVGVFAAIWVFGFNAVKREGMTAWGSITLRFVMIGMVFFTQPGLMVAMLILLPSSLLLLLFGVHPRPFRARAQCR